MCSFFLYLLCYVIKTSIASAPIPSSKNAVGWQMGVPGASIEIEIFGDFSCDDTAKAYFTIIKPLSSEISNISIVFHAFPLPYHHNSFDAAQSARVIIEYLRDERGLSEKDAFIKCADALFANQTQFMSWQTPNPTENLTQSQVISTIFAPIAASADIPTDVFLSKIKNGWNVNQGGPFAPTRDAWKYAAARSVSATPTFAANGVFDDSLSEWSITNWTSWISSSSFLNNNNLLLLRRR
mmetsp:Transcript_14341/g.21650  ORF Transcript_14341/g.21650 Transcript_14341/m.21650 type:complete len:239 (-) Transcript_14341:345-1061(-)